MSEKTLILKGGRTENTKGVVNVEGEKKPKATKRLLCLKRCSEIPEKTIKQFHTWITEPDSQKKRIKKHPKSTARVWLHFHHRRDLRAQSGQQYTGTENTQLGAVIGLHALQ